MKFKYANQDCVAQEAGPVCSDLWLFSCPKLSIWDMPNIGLLRDEVDRQTPLGGNVKTKLKTTGYGWEEVLVKAFKDAVAAALAADAGPGLENDGGTCNYDTPVIILKGCRLGQVEAAAKQAGITTDKMSGRHCAGNYFVYVPLHGQAMRRTKMAEAATKSLKASGYEARTWYHAD